MTESELMQRLDREILELQGTLRLLKTLRLLLKAGARSVPEIQKQLSFLDSARGSPLSGRG